MRFCFDPSCLSPVYINVINIYTNEILFKLYHFANERTASANAGRGGGGGGGGGV